MYLNFPPTISRLVSAYVTPSVVGNVTSGSPGSVEPTLHTLADTTGATGTTFVASHTG